MLDFDTMLLHVGEFGLYQKILFIFQAPFCIFVTFVLFGQLFMVLYPMNYWCDRHFNCIAKDSVITAAQRRNISLAWVSGGLFTSDPCIPNDIDDEFLQRLQQWDEANCACDTAVPCPYNDTIHGGFSSQSGNRIRPTTRKPPPRRPPPSNLDVENESQQRKRRRKRQYGPYTRGYLDLSASRRRTTTTPTTTTTEYSTDEYGNGDWNTGRQIGSGSYGGGGSSSSQWGNSNAGRPGNGESGGGGNYGSGGYPSPGGEYGNGGDYGDRGWNPTSTRPSLTSTSRSPSFGSQISGRCSGRPPKRENKRLSTDAFVGWREPECPKRRFKLVLSNSTIILSEAMRNKRFRDKKLENIESCKVRWNRSDVPYYETIVTQGDWWCTAELYVTIAQAVFFLGAIVGGFLIGWIADTFGRVPALVIANVLGALGGALSTVSTNIVVFCVFRFITGMAFDNCFTMMYILVLEFCGPSYRTLVANLSIAIFYTLGTLLLPLLAYFINDWRIYGLAISLPMLLGLLALFFVPESARWLLSKGRAKEATVILRNFAKVNRRKVDEKVFVDFEQEATKLFSQLEQEEDEPSLAAAFRTPRLRRTFIFLIIFWSLIALVYDGHSRNIMNLANEELNVFWLFGIASMTEFPADMLLIFTLDRFGRRWLAFGSMTLSGAFSFIAAAVTPEMRIGFLVTAIISRFWVNVAFNIGLQYAAELLPTVIRAQGVNAIHIMGYVASIISPFVAAVGRSNPTLSLILLGGFSITAGFVSLFLAETLGEELPNTLEEAEQFGKNQSFWNCPICAKERDEFPLEPPAAVEERPVVMRNALRGSIRGETYRSSIISHASSSGSSRKNTYRLRDRVMQAPEPTEATRLRRITH